MVEDYPLFQEEVKRNRKVFTSRLIRHKAEWGRVINSPTILRCKSPKAPIFDFCPPWLISALASPARFSPCCSWPSLFIFQSQTCCENREKVQRGVNQGGCFHTRQLLIQRRAKEDLSLSLWDSQQDHSFQSSQNAKEEEEELIGFDRLQ